MIVWGSAGDVVNLGPHESKLCETCGTQRPFNMILQYRYGGLYWVFNFVMQRKYLLACDVCKRGWELDERKAEAALKTKPHIPFMRRFGLLALVGVAVVFLFIGALT
jgi:hypothetical protein